MSGRPDWPQVGSCWTGCWQPWRSKYLNLPWFVRWFRRGWLLPVSDWFFQPIREGPGTSDSRSECWNASQKREDDSRNIPLSRIGWVGILQKFWPPRFLSGNLWELALTGFRISCRVRSDSSPSCICRHQCQCSRLNPVSSHSMTYRFSWCRIGVLSSWHRFRLASWNQCCLPTHSYLDANICFWVPITRLVWCWSRKNFLVRPCLRHRPGQMSVLVRLGSLTSDYALRCCWKRWQFPNRTLLWFPREFLLFSPLSCRKEPWCPSWLFLRHWLWA